MNETPSMSPTSPPPSETQRPTVLRWVLRVLGVALMLGALYPYWEALRALDRRDYVSSLLAGFVGWIITQAGIELVRPESAE